MSLELKEAMALLERTPPTLKAWFTGLPEVWLLADEGPESFSARDVLAHLIHGERTDWLPRTRLILAHGEGRSFEPFDRHGFLAEARTWPMAALLDEFEALRTANLQALADFSLSPEDLAKRGLHPGLGTVTLEQLLATWVVHDLGHLAQAARVMAKRYAVETGPWIGYLPVLTR
ncbi:MAG: DinB family protein [Holophagaceae bacterium]|nr:DinB family protein [Holophagaceae bacterium]